MLSAGLRVNMGLYLLLVLSLCSCYKAIGEETTNVKPIQQRDDREFDCVDIYKQPAFDHPLLKNHKIQMSPSFSGNVLNNYYDTKIGKFSKIGLQDEDCPPGMVPIMKIKSRHLRNEYSHSRYNSKNFTNDNPSQQVDPALYGDSHTRLTTYWTVDNFGNTGCFNSVCPGFVQVHPRLHPGLAFSNTSVFGGQQFITDISIAQDGLSGHWWLKVDHQNIGYWPKHIFTLLTNDARYFEFGGEVYRNVNKPCPPMGNGRFPSRELKETSFFTEMQYVTPVYSIRDIDPLPMAKYISYKGYDLKIWKNQGGDYHNFITYGGPGGKCGK
ncbi:hypothetical protein RGQ29_007267 [Quercus rubra]|uniref:Neprosin PEP catalytic domain-containing protein n=1 Tax=Quercus rubra TaxID=3512 RepID=A0AAN7I1X3_QUERU|nr:hypothetical protein RGQ29_007267 [Quercus rubra]